jgi:adenylate cyclase
MAAVARARRGLATAVAADGTPLIFIATLHVGQVVYGNIGSPDRLDFTVLGPAVNLVSRLEALAKQLGRPVLCSAAFAKHSMRRSPPAPFP